MTTSLKCFLLKSDEPSTLTKRNKLSGRYLGQLFKLFAQFFVFVLGLKAGILTFPENLQPHLLPKSPSVLFWQTLLNCFHSTSENKASDFFFVRIRTSLIIFSAKLFLWKSVRQFWQPIRYVSAQVFKIF